jgi:pimeloyl-ACP methyl ester carboxylesterase
MQRRSFLMALLSGSAAFAAESPLLSEDLELAELEFPKQRGFGRTLLFSARRAAGQTIEHAVARRALILLHGLGESHDQRVGARAFAERYGLLSAVTRLKRPPLERTLKKQDYFGQQRLTELNEQLARQPYTPPILVCPFTPNPWRGDSTLLDRYAEFLVGPLCAAIAERTGSDAPSLSLAVGGVSMGGFMALEIFLRKPERFCGLALAQAAFGAHQAPRFAAELDKCMQRAGARAVDVISSTGDPYLKPSELLHEKLRERAITSTLRVSPGPHNQLWLRESGVIEMLLAADRAFTLHGAAAKGT